MFLKEKKKGSCPASIINPEFPLTSASSNSQILINTMYGERVGLPFMPENNRLVLVRCSQKIDQTLLAAIQYPV